LLSRGTQASSQSTQLVSASALTQKLATFQTKAGVCDTAHSITHPIPVFISSPVFGFGCVGCDTHIASSISLLALSASIHLSSKSRNFTTSSCVNSCDCVGCTGCATGFGATH
jgi:hypothetical protein